MYENIAAAWYDGQAPVEFLTVYREEEYIRQNAQGMNPEEARKFALNYYGWDEEDPNSSDQPDMFDEFEGEEELPFS